MSELIVKMQKVDNIRKHENADNLEIIEIGGWQVCEKKNIYKIGDNVVFIPPDSVLPKSLHEFLGVTNYCGHMPSTSAAAAAEMMRVKAVRLRGEPSYGLLMSCDQFLEHTCIDLDSDWEGVDLKDNLGIIKYEPPESCMGDGERPHTFFSIYTDIEHYGNYRDVLTPGEFIYCFEKTNGRNIRFGLIKDMDEWTFMCGTHRVRRKQFNNEGVQSDVWKLLSADIVDMLQDIRDIYKPKSSVIVYAEEYGPVQDMKYGSPDKSKVVVFDIKVDDDYVDWNFVYSYCKKYNVPTVPLVYYGEYSHNVVMEFTSGSTLLCSKEEAGKFSGREGIVIRPRCERRDPKLGRVILKSVSADYLARKNATDNA